MIAVIGVAIDGGGPAWLELDGPEEIRHRVVVLSNAAVEVAAPGIIISIQRRELDGLGEVGRGLRVIAGLLIGVGARVVEPHGLGLLVHLLAMEVNHAPPVRPGLLVVTFGLTDTGTPRVGARIFRGELDGLRVVREGQFRFPLAVVGLSAVVVGLRGLRREFERLGVIADGAVVVVLLKVSIGTALVRLRKYSLIGGIVRDEGAAFLDALVPVTIVPLAASTKRHLGRLTLDGRGLGGVRCIGRKWLTKYAGA